MNKLYKTLQIILAALCAVCASCLDNTEGPSATIAHVATLVDTIEDAGSYVTIWIQRDEQGMQVPEGTYLVRMIAGESYNGSDMFHIKSPGSFNCSAAGGIRLDIEPGNPAHFEVMTQDSFYAVGDTVVVQWTVAELSRVKVSIERILRYTN